MLGDRPSRFLAGAVATKVHTLDDLFAHVEKLPELRVDGPSWAALRSAGDGLGRAKQRVDLALEVRARTVRTLTGASTAFDRLYGGLVKSIRLVDPALGADLPRFRRARKAAVACAVPGLLPAQPALQPLDAPSTAPDGPDAGDRAALTEMAAK